MRDLRAGSDWSLHGQRSLWRPRNMFRLQVQVFGLSIGMEGCRQTCYSVMEPGNEVKEAASLACKTSPAESQFPAKMAVFTKMSHCLVGAGFCPRVEMEAFFRTSPGKEGDVMVNKVKVYKAWFAFVYLIKAMKKLNDDEAKALIDLLKRVTEEMQ
jgi:hypothetical protein